MEIRWYACGHYVSARPFPGASGSYPYGLTSIGGRVYFSADNGVSGAELWSSNGTFGGTVLEADINPGPASSSPGPILLFNGRIMAVATNNAIGREWFIENVLVAASTAALPQPEAEASLEAYDLALLDLVTNKDSRRSQRDTGV